jgi:P4 family phage/plasmid primase-like protien
LCFLAISFNNIKKIDFKYINLYIYNNIDFIMYNSYKIDDLDYDSSVNTKSSHIMSNLSSNDNTISLKDYINKRKTEIGDKSLTHQWWDNIANINFKIREEEYDEFVEIYGKELKRNKKILHVMEQPKENGPLCLDFDLKQNSPERSICSDDIIHIVSIINNIIVKYYSIKNKSTLDCYVMMKIEPFFDKAKLLYSDGFHIQYPNLILNVVDRFLIYSESRKEIIKQDLFSHVYSVLANVKKIKNIADSDEQNNDSDNDLDDKETCDYYKLTDKEKEKINDEIFDQCVIIKNKWFMNGSGKNIKGDINLYQLKYIFDHNIDKKDTIPKLTELVKILSIRKINNDDCLIIPKELNEYKNIKNEIKNKYIKKPFEKFDVSKLFKSVGEDEQANIESKTNDKITKLMSNNSYSNTTQDDIQYAKKLIKLLDKKRAISYNDWITVGWALYNISPTLLPEFLDFSKQAGKKYDEQGCLKIWDECSRRYNNSGYSIPSLVIWVKEDNLEGYKKILRDKINTMLDKGDIKTDFDVACILKEIYKYDYKCSSIQKCVWWQFDSHRWNRIECAHTFSIKMSTDIAHEFAKLHADVMSLAVQETGQCADILQRKCKDIQTLIFNLKKGAFKERIIKESSCLFYEKNFESKLDQNNYLVGFTNGVYDLRNKLFRKGSPDDLISKTVGYAYREFKQEDDIIKDIEKFIESIQPEKDMRDYLMVYCASFLEGSNKDQKFMIWTGCHAINQGIMMADGTIKKVQDIKIGEQLMGDDLKPRNVLELVRGQGQMYKIILSSNDEFIVNDEHILSLVYKGNNVYSICESNNKFIHSYNELNNDELVLKTIEKNIDPKLNKYQILEDFKMEIYNLRDNNKNILFYDDIVDISVKTLLNYYNKYNFINADKINLSYLFESRKILFDKNDLSSSTVLDIYGLEIVKLNNDNYYGFKVDDNNRYLMDNYIITHNCGMNGKGSLIDLLDNTFNGDSEGYFGALPPTVLTQKRGSSSSATPELADKFGKRVITLQEPEGDDKINTGFMKNITGQDKIEARPLYGDPFQYTPQFKLLLACNHLPNIPSDDGGTWRRIRVIDFFIKFTSDPQNKNERKSDPKLREKIKNWNQGFMWLLINVYYSMYVENEGLEKLEPERVRLSTNKYKADSNVFMEFFNEGLERDSEYTVLVNDVYDMFKGWYTNSYNDKKPLPRKKLLEYFEHNGYNIISNNKGIFIKGLKSKDPSQVDIHEFDANLQQ